MPEMCIVVSGIRAVLLAMCNGGRWQSLDRGASQRQIVAFSQTHRPGLERVANPVMPLIAFTEAFMYLRRQCRGDGACRHRSRLVICTQ